MPATLVLFDIDGTILLSDGAGLEAMTAVTRRLFQKEFSWDGINPAGGLDPLLFREAMIRNGHEPTASAHDAFRREYAGELEQVLGADLLPASG